MFAPLADHLLARLVDWDTSAFLFLNGHHAPLWDSLMQQVSSPWILAPVHLLLLATIFRGASRSRGGAQCGLLLLVIVVDLAGAHAIKDAVQRVRPCNVADLASAIHFVGGHRSGAFSFVSTHTAYAFALAGFAWFSLAHHRVAVALTLWAAAVGYSRIYLGLHYPGDILGGALWGVAAAGALHGVVLLVRHRPWHGSQLPETITGAPAPARLSSHP